MKLNCYKVKCQTTDGTIYNVGVMTADEESAKHSAEFSLLEGSHVKAKAIEVEQTEGI